MPAKKKENKTLAQHSSSAIDPALFSLYLKLHPYEQKLLVLFHEALSSSASSSGTPSSAVASASSHRFLFDDLDFSRVGLLEIEAKRALQWLENKNLVHVTKERYQVIELGPLGIAYAQKKLPEVRLCLGLLSKRQQDQHTATFTQEELTAIGSLDPDEISIVLGIGTKVGFLERNQRSFVVRYAKVEEFINAPVQALLERLYASIQENNPSKKHQEHPAKSVFSEFEYSTFSVDEQQIIEELLKRKQILFKHQKLRLWVEPASQALSLASYARTAGHALIETITPQLIKEKAWVGKHFRAYDVRSALPQRYGGRRHFVNEAIRAIKSIWLEMGFVEMKGSIVQTAFWDLDALYVPQDHPARAMQDTFYLKAPNKGNLPPLKATIKEIHESGGKTGSLGWRTPWSEEEASKLLLRTHTTVLSAQMLANLKGTLTIPGKYFCIGKVFRNETLDWKHLFEFDQVEGIVIGQQVTLGQLKGYLSLFYGKLGFKAVRMRPAHFPYTEPSMEIEVLHPKGKWIELGGAGIFRPEVTAGLMGKEIPVLAWGLGLARIISLYYHLDDIRDLYKNDVKQLRQMHLWMR
ncbi:MAG: phenylalanine--tRNA ligase subunit alpha [Candidatus Woesearchaeota archaeon]